MKNTWLIPIIEEMENGKYGSLMITFQAGSVPTINKLESIKNPCDIKKGGECIEEER